MNASYIKLAMAAALFVAWVLLVVFKVSGADELIQFIKTALEGLGLYHAVTLGTPATPSASVPPIVPAAPAQPPQAQS